MKRIYVDFNTVNFDERGRVHINTGVHPELIEEITDGMRVIFYDEGMEVEGTIEYDARFKFWLGQLDWPTKRDI
jgi:hypothetical protein